MSKQLNGIFRAWMKVKQQDEMAPPIIWGHCIVHLSHPEFSGNVLHTSGVVPTRSDGTVPDSIADQAEVVWSNLLAMLDEAQMTVHDVVSVTTYVVVDHMASLGQVMAARDRALGGRRVASTLVTVPALARPEWKMEIALVAAYAEG